MKILIVSGRKDITNCLKMACEEGLREKKGCESAQADGEVIVVRDALAALDEIDKEVPVMVFFEMFLTGVSGVNFLNELIMDERMAKTALVLMVDNEMEIAGAEEYGIVRILNLEKMRPQEVVGLVKRYAR